MGKANFSDDFKRDRSWPRSPSRGYPVAEVSRAAGRQPALALRLEEEGFAAARQRRQGRRGPTLEARVAARVTEERDILKKGHRVLRQGCKVRYAFVARRIARSSRCGRCVAGLAHPPERLLRLAPEAR